MFDASDCEHELREPHMSGSGSWCPTCGVRFQHAPKLDESKAMTTEAGKVRRFSPYLQVDRGNQIVARAQMQETTLFTGAYVAYTDYEASERSRFEDREILAAMMLRLGLSTGHGDTIADLVLELEQQVAELRKYAAQQWLPIEGAPKDGRGLLMADATDAIFIGRWEESVWLNAFDFDCEQPTHWMPLPAAPGKPE